MRAADVPHLLAISLFVSGLPASLAHAAPAGSVVVKASPPARLVELSVLPASVVIDRPQATQRLIVTGRFSDGSLRDLTGKAAYFAPGQRAFVVDPGGTVLPRVNGMGELAVRVTVAGRTFGARVPVEVRNAGASYRWDFATQIAPLLTRAGCNGTACHGAANGRGGFRLSAFGHDPGLDFETITRSAEGRRLDRHQPGRSLLLTKPTLAVSHAGGLRFRPGSAEYRLLSGWIAAGAPRGGSASQLERVEIAPQQTVLTESGQQQRLLVTALYADGTREDVTSQALLETKNPAASALSGPRVSAVGLGEAPIIARYGGLSAVATVSTTLLPPLRSFPDYDPGNLVDREVYGRLRRLRLRPAETAEDDEFVRRIYLDLIGRIPTADELQAFFVDIRTDKRVVLIDRLLASPEFAVHWRDNVNYLLMGRAAVPGGWKAWLEQSLRENRGWDALARDMLTARAEGSEPPPSQHFLASRFAQGDTGLDQVTRDVTRVFFGVDIQCARCHTHPEVSSWHQSTYWGISSFFGRSYPIQVKGTTFLAERATGEVDYFGADKNRHPATPVHLTGEKPGETPAPAKDGPALYLVAPEEAKEKTRVPVPKYSRRQRFVDMAITPSDPYFKRALVNWVWSQLMGRGLVEPVDQMHEGNPASHPALLATLSEEFAQQGFRLKPLIRSVVTSRTYAQGSGWDRGERPSPDLFAVAEVRPLSLWQLANSTLVAAGYWDQARAAANPTGSGQPEPIRPKFEQAYAAQLAELRQKLDAGTEVFQAGVSQSLYLANSPGFNQLLAKGALAESLLSRFTVDAELIRAAYRAVLSREPSPEESAHFRAFLRARFGRQPEAVRQIVWALATSSEFRFNH